METYLYDQILKCPECGNDFHIVGNSNLYTYFTRNTGRKIYQCSYQCYNHAMLRNEKKLSSDTFWNRVKRSEESMLLNGKKILKPITR